ncbi:MAG: FGGY-family carbohydrate kinase [Anaerolineaceae bacterium]
MEPFILSVDLGTTSIKLAIIDKHGQILATTMREYVLETKRASYVECSEETYWDAFTSGLKELLGMIGRNKSAIKVLGISAQGETLFFLDEKGKALRDAIVWMDNRAENESAELRKKFTDEVCYKTTGQVAFDPCWPAAKVLWVKKNQPDIFAKTKTFALIEDWFIFRLTGQMVSEGSLLCSTVYWNVITKKWWQEMLDYLGISEDCLPKILEPGQVVAKINPTVADNLGLGHDVTICTGALDQAAAAIGIGNIEQGRFSENIGAALAICAPVSKPLFDPNRKMPLHYFGIPNMYMLHTFTTGGMALKWFRDSFCDIEKSAAEFSGKDAYDVMTDEASQVPAGSDGLVALPHLSGSMAPDVNPKAKGVFYGFTMKHGKPHFIRAIMESIGYIIRRNIESLENAGLKVSELRSSGGGSKSPLWNQIKADIIGKPLVTIKASEAACLGAAILAGTAIGLFDSVENACESMAVEKARFLPNQGNCETYNLGYQDYKKLFSDLNELFELTYRQ